MRVDAEDNVNVLLVDDRRENLIALEGVLRADNLRIHLAESGTQALELLLKYDFALAILDVQMPDMDGFELAELMRGTERTKNVPLIFLTAGDKDQLITFNGYQSGAVDVLYKPFDPMILRNKVNVFIVLDQQKRLLRTRLQQLEEALSEADRSRQALEESEARFRRLADSNLIGVMHGEITHGLDSHMTEANDAVLQMLGYEHEDLHARRIRWIDLTAPENEGQIREALEQAREFGASLTFETEFLCTDGERVPVLAGFARHEQDRTVAFVVNQTERKRTESELKAAKEVAETANRAKSAFLANMSHEIRTPLGAMMGFAELLINPQQSEIERLTSAQAILRNGEQLLQVINEVLDLSKVESDRLELEILRFPLQELLNDVISLLQMQAREKGLSLRISTDGPVPAYLTTDPTRLRQILINIIGNAIKFTDAGGIDVVARCEATSQGRGRLILSVTDTGCGVSKGQEQKIFKPFVQADSSTTRRYGGTGLGLALSRRLAQALGGDLDLTRSELGVGSTFTLSVDSGPMDLSQTFVLSDAGEAMVRPARPRPSEHRIPAQALSDVKILVVDDAPDNRLLVSRILGLAGADVECAENGVDGIRMALDGDYDVVLMDIQMPGLDGYQAASRLRAERYPRPILALTAHAMKGEKERCLEAGFQDHFVKPIDRTSLIDAISRYARSEMRALAPNLKH